MTEKMGQLEQAEGPPRLAWQPGEDFKKNNKKKQNNNSNKKQQ